MAKTETNVTILKINRGTHAKILENLNSIGENEIIITPDKTLPVPGTTDSGKIVSVNSQGEFTLTNPASPGMSNPMSAAGDLIVGGTSGAASRLAIGTSGKVLTSSGTAASWEDPAIPNKLGYLTTAPSANNTSGILQIVVLDSEPATKYDGYLYIIKASTPTGYSGTITTTQYGSGSASGTYIKFDEAPASASDYDAYYDGNNNFYGSNSFSNKTKVYVWGVGIQIDETVTAGGADYENAVEVTLTSNDTISLLYNGSGGSND